MQGVEGGNSHPGQVEESYRITPTNPDRKMTNKGCLSQMS